MSSDDAARPTPPARLLALTARIVSAHANRNQIAAEQLPELIRAVHRALGGLGQDTVEPTRREPAAPIRRSVQHDRIICLECGARFKMIKHHLVTAHDLTPDAYRERWGLGRDYPMIAPDYVAVRASIARQIGLGHRRGGQTEAAPPLAPDEMLDALTAAPDMAPAAKGRGRKRGAQPENKTPAEEAAPDAPAPARGRGQRRAKGTGAE